MPLHLLGKKSWNVYNPENQARVRRDEVAAKAQAEKEEREQRDSKAASRLEILRRGDATSPELQHIPLYQDDEVVLDSHARDLPSRKRRKLAGEDDTDRDIRLAKIDATTVALPKSRDVSLVDSKGHIDLVSASQGRSKDKREKQKDEAQEGAGMRFRDAAGYNADGKPWYTNRATDQDPTAQGGRDVWGNEDPRRSERERQRVNANDPLMAMKRGVRQLRENEKQRKEWTEQRERDLYEVERLAREERKRRRRYRDGEDVGSGDEEDGLEGFSLDAPSQKHQRSKEGRSEREREHHRHRDRHRSRSPERNRDRPRHRHRSHRNEY